MIKYYANFIKIASTIILPALILSACEIIIPKEIEVKEEEVLSLYQNVPLTEVMNNVQKKFQKAEEEEIYFYSPNNYRTARAGLQVGRAYIQDPEKRTYVLTSLHRADKALDDAFEVKKIVVRELDEHIKVKIFLDNLQAKKTHTREYRDLMGQLIFTIERIEKDKEAIFSNPESKKDIEERKKSILQDMLNFRLVIVKYNYLNRSEVLISEAESYDAKNIAPVTYARTVAARNGAVKYVTENVENLEGIANVAKKLQYEAERLLHITRAVETVLKLEKDTQEQYILKWEENMDKIADALKEAKQDYQSFAAQAIRYAGAIRRMTQEKQDLALQVADLRTQSESVPIQDTSTVQNTESAQPAEKSKSDSKGLQIVPIDGDPEQIRKSLRILTDQVYQLTVEKNEWESERANLKAKIKKLSAAQNTEAAKPDAETKTENKKAASSEKKEAEKKTEAKSETKP